MDATNRSSTHQLSVRKKKEYGGFALLARGSWLYRGRRVYGDIKNELFYFSGCRSHKLQNEELFSSCKASPYNLACVKGKGS